MPSPIHVYRPQRSSPEDLEAILVGREPLLQEVLGRLQHWTPNSSRQHYLLIGPRGIGKTCLLVLIEHRIRQREKLRAKWAPILFAEDAYKITSVGDLLLEALRILAEQTGDADLDSTYGRLRFDAEENRVVDLALDAFRRFHRAKKQGVLLMVENINRVLERQIRRRSDIHLLRKILTEESWLMAICTSPTYLDAVTRVEEPFFEFFQVKLLAELTQAEQESMLRKKAVLEGNTGFEDYLEKYRSRIQALYHFTGGNPRLGVMLYDLVANHNITDVATDLDLLLDQLTPFYQHRMEDLAEQERKLLETMALLPEGCSPTELAKQARVPAKVTRALLTRLERANYIRREARRRKRTVYIIPERFFRIWHQMNHSRAARGRIQYLLEFFTNWYATRWERDQVWKELTAKFETGLDASDFDHLDQLDEYMSYIMDLSRGPERIEREFDRLRSRLQIDLPEQILAGLEHLDECYGNDPKYLRCKGYFLANDLGRHEEALDVFQEASLSDETNLERLFDYAHGLDRTGREARAMEVYEQVAQLLTKRKGKKGLREAHDLLLDILSESGGKALKIAAWVLGRTGNLRIASRIRTILAKSSDSKRKFACVTALGLLRSEEAIPILTACLQDPLSNVRGNAATALGRISAAQAVEALICCLQDPAHHVRGSAATALGRIGAPRAVEALIDCLQDPDHAVRGSAATALGRIGVSQAVEALIICLQDPATDVRGSAATALGRIGAPRAVEVLIDCLQDPVAYARGSVATALGRIGAPRAVEALVDCLQDPIPAVRGSAGAALGRIGAPQAVEALIDCLHDPAPDVQHSAEIALTRLASEQPDQSLVEAVAAAFRSATRVRPAHRNMIARALLRCAFRSNQAATVRKQFELVVSELGDSGGMWAPYQAALRYLESNRDPAVLDQQNPEMREAIELLVGAPPARLSRSASL